MKTLDDAQFYEQDYETSVLNQVPVLPPLERKRELLEDVDLTIPGEIVIDKSGKLLLEYLDHTGVIGSLIETYDNWTQFVLPKQIKSRTFNIKEGVVSFDRISIEPPSISSIGKNSDPLLPVDARNYGYTYSFNLYADVILNDGSLQRRDKVLLGSIPVMLGSSIDHLRGKTKSELSDLGESISDPFGYFIIKGNETVILIQEKLRANRIVLYDKKTPVISDEIAPNVVNVICKMTSSNLLVSSNVVLGTDKTGSIEIHLGFMKRTQVKSDTLGNTVPVISIFRMLGIESTDEIMKFISRFVDSKWAKKSLYQLLPTFIRADSIGDPIEHISKNRGDGNMTPEEKREMVISSILRELFPHIPVENVTQKLLTLSIMIAKYLEYKIGIRRLDDRDNWSNKRLESAGRSMEQLFGNVWKDLHTKLQENLDKNGTRDLGSFVKEFSSKYQSLITENFESAFRSNNWGVKGSFMTKENITELLSRESILAVYSHVTRINTPTSRKAKNPNIRLVHTSQVGYVDVVETPEGKQCVTLDTPILMDDGSWKKIEDIVDNQDKVITIDSDSLSSEDSKVYDSFKYHTGEKGKKLYKLTTINGRTIRATEDHPFLTLNGWKTVKELTPNDNLCVHPSLKPVNSENYAPMVVMSENIFRSRLKGVIKDTLLETHIKFLRNINLLNIDSKSKLLPILARIIGYTLADGTLAVYKQVSVLSECFGQENDAIEFEKDVERLGYDKVTISYRITEITDKTTGRLATHHTYRVQHTSSLASLLIALGFSYGKKTSTFRSPVPDWIMTGSDLVKREFVSGFQGGDGTAIQFCKRPDKVTAYTITLGTTVQHIEPKFSDSLLVFMTQISKLINELGVKSTRVSVKEDKIYGNMIVEYFISNSNENIVDYMDTIGYRYCESKFNKGIIVTEYLKYKLSMVAIKDALKKTVIRMYKNEVTIKAISVELGLTYRQAGSIIEYWRLKGDNTKTLAPRGALSLETFLDQNPTYKNKVYLKLALKELVDDDYVADFTTVSNNHSFIANGFVTHNCGLVKAMSLTTYISVDRSETPIVNLISEFLSADKNEFKSNSVLLNGKFIGWCDGPALRNYCVRERRKAAISKDISIVLDTKGFLYIHTDAGRPTRPLLIVNDEGKLVIEEKNLWKSSIDELLREGAVEYIDSFEQEYLVIAQSIEYLDVTSEEQQNERYYQIALENYTNLISKSKNEGEDPDTGKYAYSIQDAKKNLSDASEARSRIVKYTHSELDPTAILGVASSIIPAIGHNQGPRNTYQASMGKQALGIYHSNHMSRFDPTMKMLAYPARPLFENQINEFLGLNELPAGDIVTLAIATFDGFNQEDALVMNQASIDRGLFRQVVYKSYKTVLDKTKDTVEEFARPPIKPNEPAEKYAAIGLDGLPVIGAYVKEGDCIIGKIRTNTKTGLVKNVSTYVELGQSGVVDRISDSRNKSKKKIIHVKIRDIRVPEIGDKYASRYAQKATIGMIMQEEDMPFNQRSGLKPDIIINPLSIPSRMTIGKLIEIIASKEAALSGERVNSTSFRKFDINEMMKALTKYGYSPSGEQTLVDGRTGIPFKAKIFMGPCYYQVLRHHVKDKIQVRQTGSVKQDTRQPVSGRKRGGGLKSGEMERDALISHGAAEYLKDTYCARSDPYESVYCYVCGNSAISSFDEGAFVCRKCEDDAKFGRCTIPYAFKYLKDLLAGAGINIKYKMRPDEKVLTHYQDKEDDDTGDMW